MEGAVARFSRKELANVYLLKFEVAICTRPGGNSPRARSAEQQIGSAAARTATPPLEPPGQPTCPRRRNTTPAQRQTTRGSEKLPSSNSARYSATEKFATFVARHATQPRNQSPPMVCCCQCGRSVREPTRRSNAFIAELSKATEEQHAAARKLQAAARGRAFRQTMFGGLIAILPSTPVSREASSEAQTKFPLPTMTLEPISERSESKRSSFSLSTHRTGSRTWSSSGGGRNSVFTDRSSSIQGGLDAVAEGNSPSSSPAKRRWPWQPHLEATAELARARGAMASARAVADALQRRRRLVYRGCALPACCSVRSVSLSVSLCRHRPATLPLRARLPPSLQNWSGRRPCVQVRLRRVRG